MIENGKGYPLGRGVWATMSDKEFQSIPSLVPQMVAERYGKDIVVVVTYDHNWKMLSCTSHGKAPEMGDVAARWADLRACRRG
jgi:hypothetical protein